MSSEESESYRLQMLRRLEQIDRGPPPPEIAEAKKMIAAYDQKQQDAREAIPRLRTLLPEPDLCPECYYLHDQRSKLIAVPAADPRRFDKLRCRQCSYDVEYPLS